MRQPFVRIGNVTSDEEDLPKHRVVMKRFEPDDDVTVPPRHIARMRVRLSLPALPSIRTNPHITSPTSTGLTLHLPSVPKS